MTLRKISNFRNNILRAKFNMNLKKKEKVLHRKIPIEKEKRKIKQRLKLLRKISIYFVNLFSKISNNINLNVHLDTL